MNKRKNSYRSLILAALVLILILAGLFILLKPKQAIPKTIQKQLDFIPYAAKGHDIRLDKNSYKYDPSQKGLSFTASSTEYGKLTFSEQPTPQQFIDIPDLYTKLIDKLNRYSVFNNQLGTVYLTKPADQKNGQTAVINSSGVLMFVRSEKDLTDSQWRKIFESVTLQHP